MWKPTINYCGYVPPASSDELYHSAKGSSWKKHKYIRKEGNRYIYKDTPTKVGTKDELWDYSKSIDRKQEQLLRDAKSAAGDAGTHKGLAEFDERMQKEIPGYKEKNAGQYASNIQRGLEAGAERRRKKKRQEESDLSDVEYYQFLKQEKNFKQQSNKSKKKKGKGSGGHF